MEPDGSVPWGRFRFAFRASKMREPSPTFWAQSTALMKKLLPLLLACAAFVCVSNLRAQDPAPAYHSAIVGSFGKNVVSVSGKLDPQVIKTKKYLFVYFSAHWCPPCRKFTPLLVDFYNKNYANGDFDLVFVSSDRSQGEMSGYMKEAKMPWIGLKLDSRPARAFVKMRSGDGIPNLILLNEKDEVIAQSYDSKGNYTGPSTALKVYAAIKKAEKAK